MVGELGELGDTGWWLGKEVGDVGLLCWDTDLKKEKMKPVRVCMWFASFWTINAEWNNQGFIFRRAKLSIGFLESVLYAVQCSSYQGN